MAIRKKTKKRERFVPWPKRFTVPVIIVAVILLGHTGWLVWSRIRANETAIDTTKYQAVFLSNGQVYFGKLAPFAANSFKLTNIYYLQGKTDTENPETSTDDSVQLIKLGNEVHGPEDQMIINKDQVLYYENLKSNSKVSQTISKFTTAQ